jgi:hypothetical protein
MKKLKKSLKNNLLKINLNKSYFILKNTPQIDSTLNKVQTLTRSNIKHIGINDVVDTNVLKFPLVLETFNNFKDLQKILENSKPVIVKYNNLVFKNNSSNILTKFESHLQFLKLKTSVSSAVSLLLLIKGYLKLKNK